MHIVIEICKKSKCVRFPERGVVIWKKNKNDNNGFLILILHWFLPRDAMHSADYAVRLSVTRLSQTWLWVGFIHGLGWVGLSPKFSWLKWVGLGWVRFSYQNLYICRYYNYQTV